MRYTEKTEFKSNACVIKKYTCKSGYCLGDYYWIVFDKDGNFLERISNRMSSELNKYYKM